MTTSPLTTSHRRDAPAPGDLLILGSERTLQVVSARQPGPPRHSWVVRLGQDLYVRSAPGSAWSVAGGAAHLQVDGARRPVVLAEVAPELHSLLDDAYLAKYGRCAPEKQAEVTSDRAAASTFRVRARRATWSERVAVLVSAAQRSWSRQVARRRRPQEPCLSR